MKQILKNSTLFLALTIFVFSLPAKSVEFFTIGSGASSDINFELSNAICKMVAKQPSLESGTGTSEKSYRCTAPATSGSLFNLAQVQSGNFQFAFARSDEVYTAYNEIKSEQIKPFKEIRSIFSTTPTAFQLITKKNSDIKDWKSLKGKIVRIGKEGTSDRQAFDYLIEANRVNKSFFSSTIETSNSFASEDICKKKIDAFGFVGTIPEANIEKAASECGAHVLDLTNLNINRVFKNASFYSKISIPKGTYKNNDKDIVTFGFINNLITHEKVSDEIVYNLVKSIFDNFPNFKKENPLFNNLKIQQMIKSGLSAPLHPGAIRYYKEKGWM
jgi:uncharacterized protein